MELVIDENGVNLHSIYLEADYSSLSFLLETERRCTVSGIENDENLQRQITPRRRRKCLKWMMEVAVNYGWFCTVLPLAANIMDTYLERFSISKKDLKLLGSVSLMLASKILRERPIRVDVMAAYTDFKYSTFKIIDFEMCLFTRMNLTLPTITAYDFMNAIVPDIHIPTVPVVPEFQEEIQTYMNMCIPEPEFARLPQSHIAVGVLGAALTEYSELFPQPLEDLIELFNSLTQIPHNVISSSIQLVSVVVQRVLNPSDDPAEPTIIRRFR